MRVSAIQLSASLSFILHFRCLQAWAGFCISDVINHKLESPCQISKIISSNNTHKDVITKLSRLFAGAANGGIHQDGFIDVADDLTSTYAVTGIAGLSSISVQAAGADANA